MQRVTISIDEGLGATFDRLVQARGYQSRSEGVRDLVREAVEVWVSEQPGADAGPCVGSLSYIYDRETRELAQRLSELQHEAHDLVVSATQVRLDHRHTLESVFLKGQAVAVLAFADRTRAERGVRFGALNLISVESNDDHDSKNSHKHSGHKHLVPRSG